MWYLLVHVFNVHKSMKLEERQEPGGDNGGELAAEVGFAGGGA